MPTDAHAITTFDWPSFVRLMADYRAGKLGGKATSPVRVLPGSRPIIRAILLEDLEAGGTVEAAVTRRERTSEVQEIVFLGTVTGGTFTLTFEGETTAAIDHDADAGGVQTALEALEAFNEGDINVSGYEGRYVVEFTGQYAATDVPLLTAANSLTGSYNQIRINSAFQWVDANRSEDIHCQLGIGTPTPLVAGVVVTAGWIAEGACYGILNAECRDLNLTVDGY